MMKQIKAYITTFSIIFFSLAGLQVNAQTYEQTLDFANKQFQLKNFNIALKTYKRVIFFGKSTELYPVYEKVAGILFQKNDFDAAEYYYDLAYKNTHNDSLKNLALFRKSYCEILTHNYNYALMDLMSINSNDKKTDLKTNFYLATSYFAMADFDKAEKYFLKCVNDEGKIKIKEMFHSKKLNRPNPKTAKILSMILPGTGQIYSGQIVDGLKSIMLLSVITSIGVYTSKNVDMITGVLTTIPWLERYYTGGYKKAFHIAKLKRQKNRSQIYNQIIDIVNNYQVL